MGRAALQQITAGTLPQFARILLVTDFSSSSVAAVPVAKLMAESYEGTVTAVHVIFRDEDVGPNEAVIGTPEEIAALAEKQISAFLANNSLLKAESIVTTGPFEEAIANVVRDNEIEVVVVGTHARTGVGKIVLGSVAQRIFNSVSCPVITVSRKVRGLGPKLNKILCTTDMSESSLRALPYALSLAKANNAELLLAYAAEGSKSAEYSPQDLAELIPTAARCWCRLETTQVTSEPASGIVTLAASSAADLIVMCAERLTQGPLYRFNVPFTTAYQIVANAPCPVLRVHG